MAGGEQVIDSGGGAVDVVRSDAVRVEMCSRTIDEDECGAGTLLLVEECVVTARGNDDDPIDAPVTEGSDELALAKPVLVAAACEHQDVSGASRILDRTVERGGERVGHVFQHEADRLGLAP